MPVTDMVYLEHYLDAVDKVMSGRPGSISEDRWLINNYDPEKLRIIQGYLSCEDEYVRAETVLLLTDVRERAVRDKVEDMRKHDSEKVRMACLGYISAMKSDDELISDLFDILDHANGAEFINAANRMGSVGTEDDVPHLRKIYGQVAGERRSAVREALNRIVSRHPALVPKRDLILSVPKYPDENDFEKFLDTAVEYIDVRYRANVFPEKRISRSTFNNVARALSKMRTRLYNEADNLQYYGPDKTDRSDELTQLIIWANKDLSGKEVIGTDSQHSRICSGCGGMLVCYKGMWICPDCGGNL